jgi:hypothetical protein
MLTQLRTALEVVRWALGFHRRHAALITALSLVVVIQRVAVQFWDLPGLAAVAGELVTALARLALVAVVVRIAILSEPAPPGGRWRSARIFLRDRWPSLVVQWVLLMAVSAVTVVIPNVVLAPLVPSGGQPYYWAGLLAVKNVTIIPFTMIWMVGAVRQMVRYAPARPRVLADHGFPTGR